MIVNPQGTKFLYDALDIICNSRRVVAWSYPLGFFLVNKQKKNFFEHLQNDLEHTLEVLEGLIIKTQLQKFIEKSNTTEECFL